MVFGGALRRFLGFKEVMKALVVLSEENERPELVHLLCLSMGCPWPCDDSV